MNNPSLDNPTFSNPTLDTPPPVNINARKNRDATILAVGGVGFLGLAVFFLWRDLALPAEAILLGATMLAAASASLRWPHPLRLVAPATLMLAATAAGGWYLADPRPVLLWGSLVALAGGVGAVVQSERATDEPPTSWSARLSWYAAGLAFVAATRSFYFHFLTLGVAADSPARRIILTVVWLAVGLALFVAGRPRRPGALHVGVGLIGAALLKTVAYDTVHLHGPARVAVMLVVGGLLLAGARVARRAS